MKKNHFWQSALFASALLFGFTACSSDDNGAPQQNTNQERTLTIAFSTSNSSIMRATNINSTTDDDSNEKELKWAVVGIFDGSGNTVKVELVQEGDATPVGSTTKWPTGTKVITLAAQGLNANYEVYVVGNPQGAATTPAAGTVAKQLIDAANKNAFLNATSSMEQTLKDETVATKEREKDFLMIGQGKLVAATPSDGVDYKTGTIKLYRMVAKVGLTEAKCNLDGTIYAETTVKIKEIYLDNVPSSQKVNLVANTDNSYTYSTGLSSDASSVAYLSTDEFATAITLDKTTDMTNDYFFYTMPNAETDKAKATRLVVKCDFGGTTVYYPIYLNYTWDDTTDPSAPKWAAASTDNLVYENWTWNGTAREAKKVYPNDYYNVKLAIKSIGVTDPDQDLDPQAVEVNVTVADWKEISQNATFTN